MAFSIIDHAAGYMPIANTDAGQTTPNSATVIPTLPMVLGMVVKAVDPTYGMGEFILLPGVASNIVGFCVTYSPTTFACTALANTANLSQPIAVSMSANTSTTAFSWYQIEGLAVVKKTAVKVDPVVNASRMYISATAGRLMQTSAAGKCILGAARANVATVTSTTSTVVVSLNRPHAQGPIT